MRTQIRRWGNSLAVRIPKPFALDLGLDQESTVEVAVEEGCLVIRPAPVERYELDELVSRVTEANLHGEISFGPPMGDEAW